MIAPVDGSGSWPAWTQTVEKRAVAGSFTGTPVGLGAQDLAEAERRSAPAADEVRFGQYDSLLSFGFQIGMASRRLADTPTPARRRQAQPSPPMLPDDSGRSARDLLLHSWPGRLFIIAAALKILVALVRLVGDVPTFLRVLEHGRDDRPGVLGPLLPHAARLSRAAAPALARAPQADPLLHLHRRRPVAADSRVLPARARRYFAGTVAAYLFRDGYDDVTRQVQLLAEAAAAEIGRVAADDRGNSRSRAAERLGVAPLSDAVDGLRPGVGERSAPSCRAARGSTCAGLSEPSGLVRAGLDARESRDGFTGTTR